MNHSREFIAFSRRVVMAVTVSLLLGSPLSFAAQQDSGKVGVVDFPKIQQMLPETKQAASTLQATVAPIQKELARLELAFQKATAEYRQLPPSTKPAVKAQKENEVKLKAQAAQNYQQEQNALLQKKEQDLTTPIRDKIVAAIKVIAQQEGFSVVVEKNASWYTTPEHDLTAKVINQLNIQQ
ncbi:MAG: OmpH family outer membrane protein [Chlorobium sp.]|nr:MAG: OmpH family outer membrane protein [Chlorobium sp.]